MLPLLMQEDGEPKSILAVSNGRGARDDPVICVFVDRHGRVRDQTRFDNLTDDKGKEGFTNLLTSRPPGGIIVGGLSIETSRLYGEVKALIGAAVDQAHHLEPLTTVLEHIDANFGEYGTGDPMLVAQHKTAAKLEREELYRQHGIPLAYVPDAVARLYMNSNRAQQENPGLPLTGRYGLALARYAQNPLNSYCSLGADIVNITFVEHHQKLVSEHTAFVIIA
jgi:transcription elongation factor SPT6